MTLSVTHAKVSAKSESSDPNIISKDEWNAIHNVLADSASLLGRTTAATGAVEKITLSHPLYLEASRLLIPPGLGVVQFDEFTNNLATWTKHANCKLIFVQAIGGGASGGGGGYAELAFEAGGGSGGQAGTVVEMFIPEALVGATVSITVGIRAKSQITYAVNGAVNTPPQPGANACFGDMVIAHGGRGQITHGGGLKVPAGASGQGVIFAYGGIGAAYNNTLTNQNPGFRGGNHWNPRGPGGGGAGGYKAAGGSGSWFPSDGGAGWSLSGGGQFQLTSASQTGGGGAKAISTFGKFGSPGTSRTAPEMGDGGGAGIGGDTTTLLDNAFTSRGGDGGDPGGGGGGGGGIYALVTNLYGSRGGAGGLGAVRVWQFG